MKNNIKIKFTPRDENVDIFLKDIRKTNPNADEERKLLEIYKSKDSTPEEKSKAMKAVIEMNLKFVYSMAKGYTNDPSLQMDLVDVGVIGMTEAFEPYELNTNNRFCTFAQHYIRRKITQFLGNEYQLIRQTNNMRVIPKVKVITEEFEKENHREPTVSEIEMILEDKYGITLTSTTEIAPLTIDRIGDYSTDDDERTLSKDMAFNASTAIDNLYETEAELDGMKYKVKQLMTVLSEREQLVIKMAFGMDEYLKEYNNSEIAEALGLKSAERARQIKLEAIAKMQSAVARNTSI